MTLPFAQENGISVCAVSATWGSVPKEHNFSNADRQELVHELKPYSEDEIKLQLVRFEQRSRFPTLSGTRLCPSPFL